MIHDHRPYRAKKCYLWLEYFYAKHFVLPHFEMVGAGTLLMKPWNINVHGAGIRAGSNLHIITASDRKVALSTWTFESHQGHIALGDNCLLCPGVRIDSASNVVVEDNCMLAAGAYITDADWHDIYDRTRVIGSTAPVTLQQNVWIGDGATICKGVTIGKN
ncbi:MAG: DapH/DapD/GlmU-related protein, partial [Pseudomonadales bacterium]